MGIHGGRTLCALPRTGSAELTPQGILLWVQSWRAWNCRDLLSGLGDGCSPTVWPWGGVINTASLGSIEELSVAWWWRVWDAESGRPGFESWAWNQLEDSSMSYRFWASVSSSLKWDDDGLSCFEESEPWEDQTTPCGAWPGNGAFYDIALFSVSLAHI